MFQEYLKQYKAEKAEVRQATQERIDCTIVGKMQYLKETLKSHLSTLVNLKKLQMME